MAPAESVLGIAGCRGSFHEWGGKHPETTTKPLPDAANLGEMNRSAPIEVVSTVCAAHLCRTMWRLRVGFDDSFGVKIARLWGIGGQLAADPVAE